MRSRRQSLGRRCPTPDTGSAVLSLPGRRNFTLPHALPIHQGIEEAMMGRGILLWLLGVPIPVIILLWLFFGRLRFAAIKIRTIASNQVSLIAKPDFCISSIFNRRRTRTVFAGNLRYQPRITTAGAAK